MGKVLKKLGLEAGAAPEVLSHGPSQHVLSSASRSVLSTLL